MDRKISTSEISPDILESSTTTRLVEFVDLLKKTARFKILTGLEFFGNSYRSLNKHCHAALEFNEIKFLRI